MDDIYLDRNRTAADIRAAAERVWVAAKRHKHQLVIGNDAIIGNNGKGEYHATPILRIAVTHDVTLGSDAL